MLAASCSGEGMIWERFLLAVRALRLARLKILLRGLLSALAWDVQFLIVPCFVPLPPLEAWLYCRMVFSPVGQPQYSPAVTARSWNDGEAGDVVDVGCCVGGCASPDFDPLLEGFFLRACHFVG